MQYYAIKLLDTDEFHRKSKEIIKSNLRDVWLENILHKF